MLVVVRWRRYGTLLLLLPLVISPDLFTRLRAKVLEGLDRIGARLLTLALSVFLALCLVSVLSISLRWVLSADGLY